MLKLILFTTILVMASAHKDRLFSPCKVQDKICLIVQFNKILDGVLNGYEPYGIPSLNPFVLPKVETKTKDLYFKIEPVKASGFDTAIIRDVKIDTEKQTMHIETFADYIVLEGPYMYKGKFKHLDLDGQGLAMLNGSQITFKWDANYLLEKQNGPYHGKLSNSKIQHDVKTVEVSFENIVKEDKAASTNINKIINENISILISELGPDLVNIIRDMHEVLWSGIMKHLPFDKIFII